MKKLENQRNMTMSRTEGHVGLKMLTWTFGAVFVTLLPAYYLYTNEETRFAIRWNAMDFGIILAFVLIPTLGLWGLLMLASWIFRGTPCKRFRFWGLTGLGVIVVYLFLRAARMIAVQSGIACCAPGGCLSGGVVRGLYVLVPLGLLVLLRRKFPGFLRGLCTLAAIFSGIFFISALFYPRHALPPSNAPLPPVKTIGERLPHPNIFLIIFDECAQDRLFPDGKLLEGCPHLQDFCRTATTYMNCYSEGVETPISIPRLLLLDDSGFRNLPYAQLMQKSMNGALRDAPAVFLHATNYFRAAVGVHVDYETWLGCQADYTSTFLIISVMSPTERILHLWITAFPVLNRWLNRPVMGETEGFVASLQKTERLLPEILRRAANEPVFALLHLALPHYPFVWNEDGLREELRHRPISELRDDPAGYAGNLRYMDVVLGRMLRELRDIDEFDRSLIVVTSDHAWRRDPLLGHEECPYAIEDSKPHSPYKRVPLIVKMPGQTHAAVVTDEFRAREMQNWILPLLTGSVGTAVSEGH